MEDECRTNKKPSIQETWSQPLLVLLIWLPITILFLVPDGSLLAGAIGFLVTLLFSSWLIWTMSGRHRICSPPAGMFPKAKCGRSAEVARVTRLVCRNSQEQVAGYRMRSGLSIQRRSRSLYAHRLREV